MIALFVSEFGLAELKNPTKRANIKRRNLPQHLAVEKESSRQLHGTGSNLQSPESCPVLEIAKVNQEASSFDVKFRKPTAALKNKQS
jgi:hypothetical protein